MASKKSPSVVGSFNGMTIDEWRKSDAHIKWMRKQMKEPFFRDMLAVLTNLRPTHQNDSAIELGMRKGHDSMLASILALGQFPPLHPEDIPADYGASSPDAVL